MVRKMLFSLILFVYMLYLSVCYATSAPTWITSPYFRSGNNRVINRNTGNNTTPTYTFIFSSALTGIPNLAYGVKSYRGIDQLKDTNFQVRRTGLTARTFTVSIQLYGSGNLYLLAVPFIAIDPTFPHHLNSFDNVALQYGGTLTNITSPSPITASFTMTINYTQQSSANTYKTFANPLSGNKIVLYITSLCVVANSITPFKLDISYSILNTTYYSWTASVYQWSTITKLHFSEIIYNQNDVQASGLYAIVNNYWVSDGSASTQAFPLEFADNMILGLTDFGAVNGSCGLDYNWNFQTNYNGIPYAIYFNLSFPSPNSTATGGQNYLRSTLFYLKTWDCSAPYVYFNITAELCQNACASYYYFNYTAGTCTACYYSCYNCTQANSISSCSQCEAGLKRQLINNTCVCSSGYFDDGFQPGCKACSAVDTNSLTCSYTIDPLESATFYQNIFNQTTWATDILVNFTSTTCKSNYFVNSSNICQACSSYCLTCADATTCLTCNSSLPAILYTDNLCYLCNLTNCNACYPDNICVNCSTGYILSSGTCSMCNQSCTCDGWVLPKVSGVCSTLCGDGFMVGTQQCDDGNTNDHDGCSSTCQTQSCNVSCQCDGWTAPWVSSNSSCSSVCGDGLVRGNQQCDDSNLIDGDGCSSFCKIQGCATNCSCDGWTHPFLNGVCTPICGDGLLRGSQQCDDGNIFDHDGCSSTCTTQTCAVSCQCDGWVAPWVSASCSTLCGDGIKVGLQQCDDGNTNDHDGCSSTCTLQACNISCICDGWIQPWISVNNTCTTFCGDGIIRGSQQCDDGNVNNGDGCDGTCHILITAFLTAQMTKYPALAFFALGFRIVGLQALNVLQSFQLILDSAQITSYQISFYIHGYTDYQKFPISIPTEQHILNNFNFMYFCVIGVFLIGAFLEVYYTICRKSNKILHVSQSQFGQNDIKSESQDSESLNNGEFTVHYKSEKKQKTDLFVTPYLDESQIIPKQKQYESFWGCIIFRQIFYDLLVNLLCVFSYSLVDQIRTVSIQSFINAETLIVIVSMVFLLAVILTVCAVQLHSFGENHLKFNKGHVLKYWLLIIGQKIVFAAILGSKLRWNLQIILILKFILLIYYCYCEIYFEKIQKVRSVVTHFLHFMLIFAVVLNEHIFRTFGIYSSLPQFFIEYIYSGLLIAILLICIAFYIREIIHGCEADFRYDESDKVFAITNGAINAVFDVKNGDGLEESAQNFTNDFAKSNIFDQIYSRKPQRSFTNLDSPNKASQFGGATAKKMLINKSYINNSLTASPKMVSKKIIQSHIRSPQGSNAMNMIQKQQDQNKIEQIDLPSPVSDKDKTNQQKNLKSLIKPAQTKVKFRKQQNDKDQQQEQIEQNNLQIKLRKHVRRVALKNRRQKENTMNEKVFKTDQTDEIDNTQQKVKKIFESKNIFSQKRKQPRQLTFYKQRKNTVKRTQSDAENLQDWRARYRFQSDHVHVNHKDQADEIDQFAINFK